MKNGLRKIAFKVFANKNVKNVHRFIWYAFHWYKLITTQFGKIKNEKRKIEKNTALLKLKKKKLNIYFGYNTRTFCTLFGRREN